MKLITPIHSTRPLWCQRDFRFHDTQPLSCRKNWLSLVGPYVFNSKSFFPKDAWRINMCRDLPFLHSKSWHIFNIFPFYENGETQYLVMFSCENILLWPQISTIMDIFKFVFAIKKNWVALLGGQIGCPYWGTNVLPLLGG